MAAETGIPSVYLEHQLSHGRATKKTQGSIIERLRHKTSQSRSWIDSIKSVRSSVAERRTLVEKATEPASGVQECLDTLQKAMKVVSHQTLKERLDLIGRQLGLNTQIQEQKVSLGTDAFHVDIILGDGGKIANVKLANQGDVVDCPDLKDILIKGDFTEFIEHLQGLQSIYQVTNDEKLKSKAFLALQALEKDLNQLAQFQSSISGVANYIHKCPLGIMLPRLAGKPMKLIYFVSPYDLLDKKSLTAHPLTVEAITENFLGQSVTVCIESVPDHAPANKLQTMPLMNVSKTQDGKSLPSFSAVSKINSMMLPASFVLVLPQCIPVSTQILQKITSQTNLEIHKEADVQSLRSLIIDSFSGGKIQDSRKLCVCLPDQQHIYFLDCLNGGAQDHTGVMVSRIPFTHPTHVPQILNLMRQQLLFNIVIGSCVRPTSKTEAVNSIVFEVTAVSLQQLTIVFEHPAYDTMITVDVDLSDITNLKCRVACTNSDQILCADEAVSRVFHRCMSIPIMLRWLIGKGLGQLDKIKEAAVIAAERERREKALFIKEMQQRQVKIQPATLPANRPPPQPPHPPPLPPPPSYSHHHHPTMHLSQGQNQAMHSFLAEARGITAGLEEFRHMSENNSKHSNERHLLSVDAEQVHNPLLSTLLDEEKHAGAGNQAEIHDSPMLSRLLDDNTSVATDVIPMNCKLIPTAYAKRQRKRRSQSDFSGPSPKHRASDIDSADRLSLFGGAMDLDMRTGMMDQNLHNTPAVMGSMTPTHGSSLSHHHHHHPVLNHAGKAARSQSNVIDLAEVNMVGESSLKKLADSVDKHFIHKDVKAEPDLSVLLNEADTPNRIPNILQNSPSGSKNENASTSLEGILKGSGEVGRAKDFDPSDAPAVSSSSSSSTTFSKLSSLLMASSDCTSPNLTAASLKTNSAFFSGKLGNDETYGAGSGKLVSETTFIQDIKPSPASLHKGTLRQSSSVDLPIDNKEITSGIFEKFDISRQQQLIKTEAANSEVKSQPAEGKVSLKLRVGPLRQQNSVKPYVKPFHSVDEVDLVYGKSNSIGTFDFKSDEEDDDLRMQFPSDRYVYSSSPTRLQISSSKQKQINDYAAVPHKSDKTKKKDRSSGSITKRKREKDESKREKKRRKNEHFIQESVYRTVENDTKADFKLKIRVAKKPVTDKSDDFSDGKVPSYEIKKRSLSSSVDKPASGKQEDRESEPGVSESVKEKDAVIIGSSAPKTVFNKLASGIHKSSPKSGSSKTVHSGGSANKTDPKLVTKATIRLKPLTLLNSGSTVNISQAGNKTSSSISGGNKTDRHSTGSVSTPTSDKRSTAHNSLLERRSSTSNLVDRRSAAQSSSSLVLSSFTSPSVTITTATTTTSANLSLSSILPNAPTISKIASLPRIPKLSSSSSNASISRTSSLDPVSGTSPTSAGTKSNNSYNMGPAGRPNPAALHGPAGSRSTNGITGTFSYNSRTPAPGSAGVAGNRPNFSSNRPSGPVQTSPVINSGQSATQKPPGSRTFSQSESGNSHRAGVNSANSHKHSTTSTANSVKGITGNLSSPSVAQKTFSTSSKTNSSSGVVSSKVGNNFVNQKSSTGSGGSSTASSQRHIAQNAHSANSIRTSSNSSNVSRSPNTSGVTKSPNSGKSPNITSSGRSPSVNNANRSPNVSSSSSSSSSSSNKSPNISSSSSGRSQNTSTTRSPNISNSAPKPASSSSHSSKTLTTTSHKHSSSAIKASSVNKSSFIKSHSPSPSQKAFSHISGSNKSFRAKTSPKTAVVSNPVSLSPNSQHLTNSKPVSLSSSYINPAINNKIPSGTASCSSLTETDSQSATNLPSQKSLTMESQVTALTSAIAASPPPPPIPLSPVKSDVNSHTEPSQDSKGSKVSALHVETSAHNTSEKLSTSSTPSTPQSADSTKNTYSFPSCRGRKNSLSAIVDKLKHNAVGCILDPPRDMTAFSDSQSLVISKTSSSDNTKTTSSVVNAAVKQDERETHSPLPGATAKPALSANGMDADPHHLIQNDLVKTVCESSIEGNSTNSSSSFSCANSLHSQTEGTKKLDCVAKDVSIEQVKNTIDTLHLPSVADTDHLSKPKDISALGLDESVLDTPESVSHINKIKEKQAPLKIPVSQHSFTASPSHLLATSPKSSSLQSPDPLKNVSPAVSVSAGVCKESSELVFKMPLVKPPGDCHNLENKSSEISQPGSESQTNKLENDDSNVIRENHERRPHIEKRPESSEKGNSSSKLLSSPLSDISSPENGLVIDDEESPLRAGKLSEKSAASSSVSSQQSPKSSKEGSSSIFMPSTKEKLPGSPDNFDCATAAVSPSTTWLHPAISKDSPDASAAKESDSPCPIDDDLMDTALGFGSY